MANCFSPYAGYKNHMSFFITLVASDKPLTPGHVKLAGAVAPVAGIPDWLAPGKAVDIPVSEYPARDTVEALRDKFEPDRIDVFFTGGKNRRKKIMLADMDSTLVVQETLDEIAMKLGIAEKIAPITAAAMHGHLDFTSALRQRVALLKDMKASVLEEVLNEATLHHGARILTQTMKKNGAWCAIASGGFTFFTKAISARVGCDEHFGNELGIADGLMTGEVTGRILDGPMKETILRDMAARKNVPMEDTFTIGDGSNDLWMLRAAGLGIGYHPKPVLREKLDNCILYGDLTAALFAQGYKESEFVTT